jgi:hypothetical protein
MNEKVWEVWLDVEKTFSQGVIYTNYLQQPPEEVMKDILDLIPPLVSELPVAQDMFRAFEVMAIQKCGIVRLEEMKLGELYTGQICDAFMSVDGMEMHFSSDSESIIVPENGMIAVSWSARMVWSPIKYNSIIYNEKYNSMLVVPIVLNGDLRTTLHEWQIKNQIGKLIINIDGEFGISL